MRTAHVAAMLRRITVEDRPYVRPVKSDHAMLVEWRRYHMETALTLPPATVTYPDAVPFTSADRNRGDSLAKMGQRGWFGRNASADALSDHGPGLYVTGQLLPPVMHLDGTWARWARLGTGAGMRGATRAHVLVNGRRVPHGIYVDGVPMVARPATVKAWHAAREDVHAAMPAALRPDTPPDEGSIAAAVARLLTILSGATRPIPTPGSSDRQRIIGAAFAPARIPTTSTERMATLRRTRDLDAALHMLTAWIDSGEVAPRGRGKPSTARRLAEQVIADHGGQLPTRDQLATALTT